MDDEYIKKLILDKNGKISASKLKSQKKNINFCNYIENRWNDSKSFDESVQRIVLDINEHPICKICGKDVKYKYGHFGDTCSSSCAQKYSSKNTFRSKEGQLKCERARRQTLIKKYGVINPGQIENVKEKVKQTVNKKYGVNNVFQIPEFINKMKMFINSEEFKKKDTIPIN